MAYPPLLLRTCARLAKLRSEGIAVGHSADRYLICMARLTCRNRGCQGHTLLVAVMVPLEIGGPFLVGPIPILLSTERLHC